MLRSLLNQGLRSIRPVLAAATHVKQQPLQTLLSLNSPALRLISTNLCGTLRPALVANTQPMNLLNRIPSTVMVEQKRTAIIKYNFKNAGRESEVDVISRFYRLDWGMWIHVRSGRGKKLWKKSGKNKKKLRYHVMSNAKQCTLLDKMVTKRWRRKRFLVDDPYEPYHLRESFYKTRKSPLPLPN